MNRKSGFTLIEVLVVVAILAVLSAIAYPLYNSQIEKARRSDARAALLEIAQAEERFFTVNGTYTDDLNQLSLDADLQGGVSEEGLYTIGLAHDNGDTATFVVTAAPVSGGPQDGDDCTQLQLDHLGARTGTWAGSDENRCW